MKIFGKELKFNGKRVYHENDKPTPSEIGAAAASHGTHVTYSTTAPLANGTASAGSASTVARTDHVHPLQTTVSGNAGTATKLATARTINGTSFDGSGNITTTQWGTARNLTIGNTAKSVNGSANVAWSLSEIGAAPASHTHNYAGSSSAGGNANVANTLYNSKGRVTSADVAAVGDNKLSYMLSTGTMTTGKPAEDGKIIHMEWDNNGGYSSQLFVGHGASPRLQIRGMNAGTWGSWITAYTTANPQTTITGNAGTATTLQTARTINGTSFNGSANITTANWGTARTLTIGSTGKSVNGSGNVSWTLAEIGAAAASHTHSYLPLSGGTLTGNVTISTDSKLEWNRNTDYARISFKNTGDDDSDSYMHFLTGDNGNEYFKFSSISGNTTTDLLTIKTDHLRYKGNAVYHSGNKPTASDIGAAPASHTHNYAGSSSAGGNANAAVKLATARTINGTNFDGTANITTANWGTSRKINNISVNGSADVKLPLDHYTCSVGNNNTNLYHHILASGQCTSDYTDKSITILVVNHYNGAGFGIAKATLRTNQASAGNTATGELRWLVRSGFSANQLCFNIRNTAKDTYMDIFYKSSGTYASLTWYVLSEGARGTQASNTWTKYNTNASGTNAYTEANMKTIRSYTSTLQSATDHGHVNSANTASTCTGNAATATTLQTARTINGTSFNGSANITTANWGTARTLTIGNSGKSVNGSGNVSWSLSEIGAAASSHGRHVPDNCITITDWNSAVTNGWYMGINAANAPTTGVWYFGEVIAHNSNYVFQTVYQFNASSDAKGIPKYIRAKMNGTWGAWTNVTVSIAVPSNAKFTDTNTWRGIQNVLTSTATDQSLSAAQGKVLNDKITSLQNELGTSKSTLESNINSIKGVL